MKKGRVRFTIANRQLYITYRYKTYIIYKNNDVYVVLQKNEKHIFEDQIDIAKFITRHLEDQPSLYYAINLYIEHMNEPERAPRYAKIKPIF